MYISDVVISYKNNRRIILTAMLRLINLIENEQCGYKVFVSNDVRPPYADFRKRKPKLIGDVMSKRSIIATLERSVMVVEDFLQHVQDYTIIYALNPSEVRSIFTIEINLLKSGFTAYKNDIQEYTVIAISEGEI